MAISMRKLGVAVAAMAVAASGWLVISPTAYAATSTLTYSPSGDADVVEERPNFNAGAEHRLRAGKSYGETKRTYLQFNIGQLPANTKVTKAVLRMTRDEHHLPNNVSLWSVQNSNWNEHQLTAVNAPQLSTKLVTARPTSQTVTIDFDVTSVVKGPGVFSFALTSTVTDDVARFRSKEYGTDGPKLTLTLSDTSPSPSPSPTVNNPWLPFFPFPLPWLSPTPTPSSPSPTPTPSTPSPTPTATLSSPSPSPTAAPASPTPTVTLSSPSPSPTVAPTSPTPTATSSSPSPSPTPTQQCVLDEKLVPSCGVLWGAAPGQFVNKSRTEVLAEFEEQTGRTQHIFHAYHRGTDVFPTKEEIAIAREPGKKRLLLLNYNPTSYHNAPSVSWGDIAAGKVDAQLDKIAANIKTNFPEKFFLIIHHEPEEEVDNTPGSGWTAKDYAAMYRHVVQRLRAGGATNAITVMAYMSYEPWNSKPWFNDLYPGDDVVDWIAWDAYAHSDPGKWAYGDFSEMMNRTSWQSAWPGLYKYSEQRFPHKPLMLAEWGVWYSDNDPNHQADFYKSVGQQLKDFPRLKAMVYFDTPCDQRCLNSDVEKTATGLAEYRKLGSLSAFQVTLP